MCRNSPKDSDKIQGAFGEVYCDLCKRQIEFEKYLCMFCNNLILCQYCEKNHSHPVIKLKIPFYSSTLNEIMFQYNHIINPQKRIEFSELDDQNFQCQQIYIKTQLLWEFLNLGILTSQYRQ